jgi:hypothetical protein
MRRSALALLPLLGLIAPTPAGALPRFGVLLDGPSTANFSDENDTGVALQQTLTYATSEFELSGAVDNTGARGSVLSSSFGGGGPAAGGVRLTYRAEDVVFTNESDPEDATPIEVGIRLDIRGHFEFSGVADPALSGPRASIGVEYRIGNVIDDAGALTVRADPEEEPTGSGIFADLVDPMDIDGTFTTPTEQVTPGEPVFIQYVITFSATAGGSGGDGGNNTALADFDPGVGFAGPVFDLPPGYTANSTLASVVGNYFVPEPAAGASAFAALGALASLRRSAR